ncbi:MAG: hemerythrin family protein [Nitrospinota bacterium]
MSVIWRDDMSVGNESIDNDHKYLISILNTIEAAINCRVHVKTLTMYSLALKEYTEEHFDREEKIQVEIDFPFHEGHKKEHKELVLRLKHVIAQFSGQNDDEAYRETLPSLVGILRDWLIHHILNEDMRMKEYLLKKAS